MCRASGHGGEQDWLGPALWSSHAAENTDGDEPVTCTLFLQLMEGKLRSIEGKGFYDEGAGMQRG